MCEIPLWLLNANVAVLLHFALMALELVFNVQVEPIILLETSNLSPDWSSFAQLANVCHVIFAVQKVNCLPKPVTQHNSKLVASFEQPQEEISNEFTTSLLA